MIACGRTINLQEALMEEQQVSFIAITGQTTKNEGLK